jgi:hypothetical protein
MRTDELDPVPIGVASLAQVRRFDRLFSPISLLYRFRFMSGETARPGNGWLLRYAVCFIMAESPLKFIDPTSSPGRIL